MCMLMFLLPQRNVSSQLTLLSLLWLKKEEIAKNATNRNRKSRKLVWNVWAVKLTRVFRKIETVCSVFMTVSVIVCVALYFQCLPYLNNMKSVCDSRECEKKCQCYTHYVITVAYCLVVLSVSFITAIIDNVFMWYGLGILPFLEHMFYKYWLTCVKFGLFHWEMVAF